MEEFQEADILWPESTQDHPRSFVDLQNYLHFASSKNDVVGAIASLSSSASSSSIESTCTQESDFSCPDQAEEEEEYNSYFFSVVNLPEEKIGCDDEDWQEADVLWPDQESPAKYRSWDEFVAREPENCSVRDHEHPLSTKGEARKNIVVSSPIDVPRSKVNHFVHLL